METGPFDRIELPSFEMTSYGMKCRFPIIETSTYVVAVLLCEKFTSVSGRLIRQHVGLLLHRCPPERLEDPSRSKFHCGYAFKNKGDGDAVPARFCRLVTLGEDWYNFPLLPRNTNTNTRPTVKWSNLFIEGTPSHDINADPALSFSAFTLDSLPGMPFRVPRAHLGEIQGMGFFPAPDKIHYPAPDKLPWTTVTFLNMRRCEGFRLWLGLCSSAPPDGADSAHWVRLEILHPGLWDAAVCWGKSQLCTHTSEDDHVDTCTHNCATDHVDRWEASSTAGVRVRDYARTDIDRRIRLSTQACKHNPRTTMVLHIYLTGSPYERIQQDVGVKLRPLESIVLQDSRQIPRLMATLHSPMGLALQPQLSLPEIRTASPSAAVARTPSDIMMSLRGIMEAVNALQPQPVPPVLVFPESPTAMTDADRSPFEDPGAQSEHPSQSTASE